MNNDNIFAQLQILSKMNAETTIDDLRRQLNELVEFFKGRPQYTDEVTIFAEKVRNLKVQTLLDCDSFMVQPDMLMTEIPEELQHDSLGFCRNNYIIFSGRYVYPVKDVRGNVMGFCGYDKFSETKYMDSLNFGYRAKTYSCWGMEMLPVYYNNDKPVYFVEGIVCSLYLRQEGLQSLATLGSNISTYMIEVIKRFGNRAIFICDADEAGNHCRSTLRRRVPWLRCIQSHIAKDVDDSREVDPNFVEELKRLCNPFINSDLFC